MQVMFKILVIAVAIAILAGLAVAAGQYDSSDNKTEENKTDTIPETSKKVVISTVGKEKTLDLSGQGLTKAPSYIFDRTEIQELNLSNNNIEGALQAEVRHLQNLKILDLSNNRFTGVPAEVGQLKNLEVLDLSNNELTGLPYELGNVSNLKVLNLKGNNYSTQDLDGIKKNLPASTVIQTD